MNRFTTELHRLYPASAPGSTRALMLEVAAPADWGALGAVWRSVQADLGLPAPAIAVSGTDGIQLWFSLARPVSPAQATEFLQALQARHLAELPPGRVRLHAEGRGPAVPVQDAATGNWSAFVAPDLAPVFADTPWLDVEPGADGQADLLARLSSIPPDAFEAAVHTFGPRTLAPAPITPEPARGGDIDPRQFLQRVLNDEAAPLALRVEAAKALLVRP